MIISCSKCHKTWTAVSWAHCGSCHDTFTGVTYFDQHRYKGKCWGTIPGVFGQTMGANQVGGNLYEEDGVFSTEEGHAARTDRNERMKKARDARSRKGS